MIAAFRDWLLTRDGSEEEDVCSAKSTGSGSWSPSGHCTDVDSESSTDERTLTGHNAEEEIELYDKEEVSHEMAFSTHKRLSCFDHTLQLAVCRFDTLASPKQAIQSVHKMVKRFKSVKATEKLIALCGKKLVSSCPTRWNCTFLMISRLLELRTYLTTVLLKLEWDNLPHSE